MIMNVLIRLAKMIINALIRLAKMIMNQCAHSFGHLARHFLSSKKTGWRFKKDRDVSRVLDVDRALASQKIKAP